MIKRLLIANRGEIAVRIIHTCKKMGITSIALYSDADRNAKHTQLADEAYYLGASDAASSYLDGSKIIQLATSLSIDAIHPGYGFLSENTEFAEQCENHEIIFVGPKADAIKRMGSKIESKHIAKACDVPTVPGYFGEDQSPDNLLLEAQNIGTPLLIKASAGGGGRGIRLVSDLSTFKDALALATKEATASFGDASVLLERYIEEPRHLEVQILGDQEGNIVHLFERECSIQRNHQKIIEEAPAAFLSESLKQTLYEYALRLSSHIHYSSTGTIEFIYDNKSTDVFFLEMNTRLQVEHPVTEQITGLDLVEWQIRVASGQTLTFAQKDITSQGWAIEARVTAENPAHNYQPETGELTFYQEPVMRNIRIESGVQQGDTISPFYDSMIAKVIATGSNREEAKSCLQMALDRYLLAGVGNNIAFLGDILKQAGFSSQALTTHYINEHFPGGWHSPTLSSDTAAVIAAVIGLEHDFIFQPNNHSPWYSLKTWRTTHHTAIKNCCHLILSDNDDVEYKIFYQATATGYLITLNTTTFNIGNLQRGDRHIQLEINGALHRFYTHVDEHFILFATNNHSYRYTRYSQRTSLDSGGNTGSTGEGIIKAKMPGNIEAVNVNIGDTVSKGDVVVVMEAMKMVQNLPATLDGAISKVHCQAGKSVGANAILVEIEEKT